MQILKKLGDQTEHLVLILVVSFLSMLIYALTSEESKMSRLKSMCAGGVISLVLTYPTWLFICDLYDRPIAVYWIIPITFVYTITGQFIPDALRSLVPKIVNSFVKKFYKDKTGEDL